MTAQEWLNELEGLREAATPGPWICKEGEGFDEGDVFITAEEREGMIEIAKVECGSPNAEMDEPFQSEQAANAAFIAAANPQTVQRLVEMVKYLSEEASGEVSCSGEWVIRASEEVLQEAYESAEPKE